MGHREEQQRVVGEVVAEALRERADGIGATG
jgi:hypothetical protein